MASTNMQSPSPHAEHITSFQGASLGLPFRRNDDIEVSDVVQGSILSPVFSKIAENSPVCSGLETQEESAWIQEYGVENTSASINNFERYDEETPSCSAYETIGCDELHSGLRRNDFRCDPLYSYEESTTDDVDQLCQNRAAEVESDEQEEAMALNDCLEWPTVQQEAMSFNELSDVVLDSCRLNKETSILLKMLDESSLPPTVVLCVGNDDFSKNVLDSVQNQHDMMHNVHRSALQPMTIGSNISKSRPIFPRVPSCNYRQNTEYNCTYNQGMDGNAFDGVRINRRPQPRRGHNFDPKTRTVATRSDYLAVEREINKERQIKRREKNRECSRMFRCKQRIKEDRYRKGKLEKEVRLHSLIRERERLKRALLELSKNCASCPKAMEFLSVYAEENDKENVAAVCQVARWHTSN